MLAFRFAKERLLESQKMIVGDQKLPKSKITPIEIPKDNVATTISEPTEINNSDNDPLHILRIRFAKGEISKEEYEEMRKMIES